MTDKVRRRGPQKKPTFTHINVRVTKEQAHYLHEQGNVSAAIRKILDIHMRELHTE